jgi:hypothetical protein
MMRIPALTILTIVTVWAAGPARAQTYSPDYPVCLHVYTLNGDYIECAYGSLAQCAMSASGRAAMCAMNPYFVGARERSAPRHRRHRRVPQS